MDWARRVFYAVLEVLFLLSSAAGGVKIASAQEPVRETKIVVAYTEYEWWLISWTNNEVLCQLWIDHEGLPTLDEVLVQCGQDLADIWYATPSCEVVMDGNVVHSSCEGVYLHLVLFQERQKDVIVDLPVATAWLDMEGCTPQPPENRCAEMPVLVFSGEEPLPNEQIISIEGLYNGMPFLCEAPVCKLPLRVTPLQGDVIEFWANSSYGDSSAHFKARVRVVDTGVAETPGSGGWYVDVISSQWRGAPLASCGRIWQSFPPIGGPPGWLNTPDHIELMSSEEPYYYLAGRLISQGLVDASMCAGGGLLPNGYADACGLEQSRLMVIDWQNRFDQRIIEVARQTGIPAQLMKNLFAQESQFWPGIFRVPQEFGLGQITENGVDSVLLWNPSFYEQFCPLVLTEEACQSGYLRLDEVNQATLRGAVALQARADCKDCPAGIDLSVVEFSVSLFANTLVANCEQVGQSIFTETGDLAGVVAEYEDLWKLTVANYHAGPGCVNYAMHQAWSNTGTITWEEVKNHFTDPCKGVVPYVEKIAQ